MTLRDIVTIDDLRLAAKRRLPRIVFDFVEGGVEREWGIARNEEMFRRFRLLPRYFVDVSQHSQATTLFGVHYDSPFGVAPTGVAGLCRPGADDMIARSAAAANIPFILSGSSTGAIATAMRQAPQHTWFQLYGTRDRTVAERQIGYLRDLGVQTLVVTADVPVAPKRERNFRNGFTQPIRFRPSIILDGLRHPGWLVDYLRDGGTPVMQNWARFVGEQATATDVIRYLTKQIPAADLTWRDFERYRQLWPGKLLVKGILHPQDARRALALGADGIIVSNHGGRQLDTAPAPIEVLPAIRAAVGPGAILMLDSGVRRGTDILLALCLGAQFVFVGRATLYGAAAYGEAGARKAIDILREEIDLNLMQIGCTSVDALGPQFVMAATSASDMALDSGAPAEPGLPHRPAVLAPVLASKHQEISHEQWHSA